MESKLMQSFREDLDKDRLVLTSLPEVAMKIRDALDDPEVSAGDVAAIINQDPAIAAKVLKTSNSVFFRGRNSCETVSASVARMGFATTRKLVLSFAVRDLFQSSSKELREAMRAAWEHSLMVGAIAHALAQHTRLFPPEEAMLAGILSQIGVLSVFNYVANYPEIYENEEALQATIAELKAQVGALVLDRWAFPAEYLACALQGENWERDTGKPADLCDLVIVASLHAAIGKQDIPQIDTVPAYGKLVEGQLSPEMAINFMQAAREQISEAGSLFGG